MTGIILAGGESRRMGQEKSLLMINGRPMIEHILSVFSMLFGATIIVTNTPERYRDYNVRLVQDLLDVSGPLTGIYSGIRSSKSEYNFVVACDMPFLNPQLIAHMGEIAGGHDAVVPRFNGFLEPLHAVYRKAVLPVIEDQLSRRDRQIRKIFDHIDVRYLSEQEIDRFDPMKQSFRNLNTPKEYKEATCLD